MPEEEANDPRFARQLAALGELYVNDAFGTAHRAHASTEGVAHYLPAVAGLLMAKELTFLGGALEHPRRPLVAISGGAKVGDKIAVLDRLIDLADAHPDRRWHGEHVLQGQGVFASAIRSSRTIS